MAAKKPADKLHDACRMEDILLERERLDQVLKARFRKKVTVLFSDVCGYTQYTDKKGDIQSRTMLLQHNRIVLPVIEMHAGRVIEVIGDGVMAAFEDPVDAGKAAVEIQQHLKTHNDKTAIEDRIHVKIGINCGHALMDDQAAYQSLTGDTANVAARVQTCARRDQILVSQSVYEQVRNCNEFCLRFHEKVEMKGKVGKMPVYRIISGEEDEAPDPDARVPRKPDAAIPSTDESTLINLDLNIEGDQLKISANETRMGEERTISRYETIPVSLAQIDRHCRQLVDTLNKANRRGRVTRQVLMKLREIGQVLYDELLTINVKEILRSSRAKRLIIKIDDQLIHIPWELLYDGQQFFCRRFNMGRVVKTRQNVVGTVHRNLEQPLAMMILADPTGDLKGAYTEGIQIRDFMDQSPDLINVAMRSKDATAQSIKTKLRNFDIIHFAGHSDYDVDHPETSGWRLSGGSFSTKDIGKMAGSATMPAMIFANACQSARTERWSLQASFESKIFGMANAFLVAGVKHYIGTFWEVPDEPSSRFAIEFYKHLFSGISVGEAFRKARQALIDLYGEETIVWASYVLYGDPTFDYLANCRMETSAPQDLDASGQIRHLAGERTREEVIDFSRDAVRKTSTRWWAIAGIVLLAAAVWLWGWPWFVHRGMEKLEHQAMSFYLSGDFDTAAQYCQKINETNPDNPVASLILGNMHMNSGNQDAARRYFLAAVDAATGADKIKAEALMGLGRLASVARQPQQALQYYRNAASVDPLGTRALSSQAVILERQNRDEEALRLYSQALEKFPKDRGAALAAQDIRERLSWQKDRSKQSQIDQLIKELLESDRRKIASQTDEDRWTSHPLSVWLMEFDETGIGLQEGHGRMAHVLIRDRLARTARIRMVDRAVLDKLLAELRLGSSDLAERQTALSIGRLMAAHVLMPAQIQYQDGQALVSVVAIECETGVIRASMIGTYNSAQPIAEMAGDMAGKISDALINEFPLRCRVREIRGAEITVDIGQNLSLQSGTQFSSVDGAVILQVVSVASDRSTASVIKSDKKIEPGLKLEEKTGGHP